MGGEQVKQSFLERYNHSGNIMTSSTTIACHRDIWFLRFWHGHITIHGNIRRQGAYHSLTFNLRPFLIRFKTHFSGI